MIPTTKGEWKLVEFLIRHPYEIFSISSLAKKIDSSRSLIYSVIKKFEKDQLLLFKEKRVQINLSNEAVIRIKYYLDWERVRESPLAKEIAQIVPKLKEVYGTNLLSLCLIGSIITKKEPRDIDFLIITEASHRQQLELFAAYENINLVELTEEEFSKKYLASDDFIISSLTSLLILFDNEFIIKFLQRPPPFPENKVIEERINQLQKIKERLILALSIDDYKNVKENITALLVQIIRIKLLKQGVIPKSKEEIIEQIKPIDKKISHYLALVLKNSSKNIIKKIAQAYAKQNLRSF